VRSGRVEAPASRTTAKASASTSSSDAPPATLAWRYSVLAQSWSSDSAFMAGARALMATTRAGGQGRDTASKWRLNLNSGICDAPRERIVNETFEQVAQHTSSMCQVELLVRLQGRNDSCDSCGGWRLSLNILTAKHCIRGSLVAAQPKQAPLRGCLEGP